MIIFRKLQRQKILSLSSGLVLLFISFSMLGSIKIYIGTHLNWLISIFLIIAAVSCSLIQKPSLLGVLRSLNILIKPYAPMLIGWLLFMCGIAVAGLMNEGIGLYTLIKYGALLSVFFMLLIIGVTSKELAKGLILALGFSIIPLFFFVVFRFNEAMIILGDGRMGWLAIWPGVLWKVGGYIWPYAIWRCLRYPNYQNFLLAFVSILAMALDGSRTSILWLVLTWGVLFAIGLWIKLPLKSIRTHVYLLSMVILVFGFVQPVMLTWASLPNDSFPAVGGILSQGAILKSSSLRLVSGDSFTRALMLQIGWQQAREALPWGCGFGCTGILHDKIHTVVHMTYLQILGDEGIISLTGYLLFLLFPLYKAIKYLAENKELFVERFDVLVTPISILLLYLFVGLLHPLSNELTEWAIVLTAISVVVMHVPYRNK